jgi:hypothetical protein
LNYPHILLRELPSTFFNLDVFLLR